MNDPYATVAGRLASAGFRETEPGCFSSPHSPRVIGLAVCRPEPETWRSKTEELLRRAPIRQALSWARYIVVLVPTAKTSPMAWSAAAFAQDVSKCRRIVLFLDPASTNEAALPFIGLSAQSNGPDAQPRDIEAAVRSALSSHLVDAFLNEELSTSRLKELAEGDE